MPTKISSRYLRQPVPFLITIFIIALLMVFGPVEKTLGANIRLVLLHGAWVWTGKVAFGLAPFFPCCGNNPGKKTRMVKFITCFSLHRSLFLVNLFAHVAAGDAD